MVELVGDTLDARLRSRVRLLAHPKERVVDTCLNHIGCMAWTHSLA